jgi:hypothetical protein
MGGNPKAWIRSAAGRGFEITGVGGINTGAGIVGSGSAAGGGGIG